MVIVLMLSCDPGDGKLKIVNSTSDTIFYEKSTFKNKFAAFPVVIKNNKMDMLFSNCLIPNETHNSIVTNWHWEDFINERGEDSTITIFIFKKDIIYNNTKEAIMKNQIYSSKISLNVTELNKIGWQIDYPSTFINDSLQREKVELCLVLK